MTSKSDWVKLGELSSLMNQPLQIVELAAKQSVILVVAGGRLKAYENRCPHANVRLDMGGERIESLDGSSVFCTLHGAHFSKSSGYCHWGPCQGQSLLALESKVDDGYFYINVKYLTNEF